MTEDQYKQMEEKAKMAFKKMPDNLQGEYFPLTGLQISNARALNKVFITCL